MAYTLTYTYGDNAYSVSGYTGTPDNIVIPSTYNDGINGEHGVTSIDNHVFEHCTSLISVVFPDTLTSIGTDAFSYTALINVVIPESVTSIGNWAFQRCYALTSVIIPDSVETVGRESFRDCTALTSLTIGSTTIGQGSFRDCTALKSLTISNSVTTIENWAFERCTALESVVIPNSVTSTGTGVFNSCPSLKSVSIGNGLTAINQSVFLQTALESVVIPANITSIGNGAFYGCSSLTSIYLMPTTAPTITSTSFNDINENAKFYCFLSAIDEYKTETNWNAFASKFVADDIRLYFVMNSLPIKALFEQKQNVMAQVTDLTPTTQTRTLTANTRYAFGTLTGLNITYPATANDGDKIIVEFSSEDTATTLAITNAIHDFSEVNPYCFVKLVAVYSVSLHAWVIEKTETFDVDATLENNSWSKIATICRLGLADKFWQVGDTKSVQMTFNGYTYTLHAQLVDLHKGRYEYANKAGASNVVFQFVECLPARSPDFSPYNVDDYSINGSNTEDRTNVGGWAACRMRTFLNGTVFYQLPVELQNAIAEVYVSSGIGNQTTSGTSDSANKLFLASEYEVYGGTESQRFTLDNNLEHYSIGKSEGAPEYDYWKLHPTAEDHRKRPVNTDTYNYWWWLRSPRSGGSGQAWCSVRENGSPESVYTSGELQICPCFVLG